MRTWELAGKRLAGGAGFAAGPRPAAAPARPGKRIRSTARYGGNHVHPGARPGGSSRMCDDFSAVSAEKSPQIRWDARARARALVRSAGRTLTASRHRSGSGRLRSATAVTDAAPGTSGATRTSPAALTADSREAGSIVIPVPMKPGKPRLRAGLASWLWPGHSRLAHSITNRRLLRGLCHLPSDTPVHVEAPLRT